MAYLKADKILPAQLLAQLQEYVQGESIYVPRRGTAKLGWGRKNGARRLLDERNREIQRRRQDGLSLSQLADEYGLSEDGVRKALGHRRLRAGGQAVDMA